MVTVNGRDRRPEYRIKRNGDGWWRAQFRHGIWPFWRNVKGGSWPLASDAELQARAHAARWKERRKNPSSPVKYLGRLP